MDKAKSLAAELLLKGDLFTEVTEELIAESVLQITNSQPSDGQLREEAYNDIRAVIRLRNRLQSLANDLKVHRS